MLMLGDNRDVNEQAIQLIAERVTAALREDLEAIAVELSAPSKSSEQLTVSQVARRLGVAPSTVYAHWREWGGYKLGAGDKAPIRFDSNALPIATAPRAPRAPRAPKAPLTVKSGSKRQDKQRRRRDLLVDAPKLVRPFDSIA